MNKPEFNPALDEATAVALTVIIHNQIQSLLVWQRKLKQPYLGVSTHYPYRTEPVYAKPTLASLLHMMTEGKRFDLEIGRVALKFTKAARLESELSDSGPGVVRMVQP